MPAPRDAVVWIWTVTAGWERHGSLYMSQADLIEDVRQLFVLGYTILVTPDGSLP
jgi:hypothetical protein